MATRPGPNKTPTLRAAPNLNAVLGGGWTPLPKKIRQSTLKQSTKIVYNSLCSFFQMSEYTQAEGSWQRECAWPTHEEIAQDIGEAHRNTVSHAINELLQYNVIMRQRRGLGQPDLYWLVDPEDWCLPIDNGDEEPSSRCTKNVHLDAQETGSQKHKKAADGGTVIVTPEAQETSRREHNNCDSLYKKQRRNNNEPNNNEEQQPKENGGGAPPPPSARVNGAKTKGKTKDPAEEGRRDTELQTILPGCEDARPSTPLPDENKNRPARVPVAHQDGENNYEYAAREYMLKIRRWKKDCNKSVFLVWTKALGGLIDTAGRDGFDQWMTWLTSDPWYTDPDNGVKIRAEKLQAEFEDWWNKDEPRPRFKKLRRPRDESRVDSQGADAAVIHRCIDCSGEIGTAHTESCKVRVLGKTVTQQHTETLWVLTQLQAARRGAS